MAQTTPNTLWPEHPRVAAQAGLGVLIDVTPAGSTKKVYNWATTGPGAASFVDAGGGVATLVPDYTGGTVDIVAIQSLATLALLRPHAGQGTSSGPRMQCSGIGNTLGQVLDDESGNPIETESGQTIYTEP